MSRITHFVNFYWVLHHHLTELLETDRELDDTSS